MSQFRIIMLLLIGLVSGLILGKLTNNPFKIEWLVIFGIALLLIYLGVAVFQQTRNGILHEPAACPKCGAQITRIHRSQIDRVIGVFIPRLHRYTCKESTCKWSALVKSKSDHARIIKEKNNESA